MKHKILMVALGAIMATSCAVGLAACSDEPETHTHVGVHHDAVAPTCGVDGTIEYWSCEGCNELFSDAGCTKVITSVVDPATGNHTYGEAYGRDENGHWQICTVCGEAASATEHSYIYYDADLNEHKSFCSVCGKMNEEEHSYSTEYESDEIGHWYVCTVCEAASEVVEHTWEDNECTVCGYAVEGSKGLTYEFTDETQTAYKVTAFDQSDVSELDVIIPSTYNGLPVTIIGNAFRNFGYNGHTSVTIPASVTTIEDTAFQGAKNVQINFEEGSQLKTIGYRAFYNAKFVNFTIPAGVEEIGEGAFQNCTEWAGEVKLSDSVTTIGAQAFRRCVNITKVAISNNVTTLGDSVFNGCTSLQSITLSEKLTTIGSSCFSGCTALSSVEIPDTVATIGATAFNGCSELEKMVLGKGLNEIGNQAVYNCSKLSSIVCEENEVFEVKTGCLIEKSTQTVVFTTLAGDVTIPEGVKVIGSYALGGYMGNTITLPNSLTTIEDYAFYNASLTNVNWGNSVTTIGRSAFNGCAITSINLPASVSSVGIQAFDVDNVTSFTVDSGNSIYYAKGNCLIEKASKTVVLGFVSSVIPDDVTGIGEYAFAYGSLLSEITIPDSVKTIGNYAFASNSALEKVIFGAGLESIGNYAFQSCSKLENLVFGDNLKTIGDYAFYTGAVKTVVLPASIESIGNRAFYNYPLTVEEIYYKSTEAQLSKIEGWSDSYIARKSGVIIYYYSESQPAGEGNYWHMVDGVPTVWVTTAGATNE